MAAKKVYNFSKFFIPAVILSALLILSGVISVCVRGVNFGLDFRPGLIEEIRVSEKVAEITYNGSATINLDASSADKLTIIVSGIGADNRTIAIPYENGENVSKICEKLSEIEGISAKVLKDSTISDSGLFVSSEVSTALSPLPLSLFVSDLQSTVTSDDVRGALAEFQSVDVKSVGSENERSFQVRLGVSDSEAAKVLQSGVSAAISNAFNKNGKEIVVVKSDFMSPQFSSSLITGSIWLVLATLVLIFIYATVRFKWDFALASVIAIIHDALIMVSFISWSQMEFSTTTLAAILTIIGYSINATVVILDRVRSDLRTVEAKSFVDVLNSALSATLGRSIITTITTLFAVLALYFFTVGAIHDFSLALTVGLISGCYSSIFIAGAFISRTRRNFSFVAAPVKNPNIVQFKPQD